MQQGGSFREDLPIVGMVPGEPIGSPAVVPRTNSHAHRAEISPMNGVKLLQKACIGI